MAGRRVVETSLMGRLAVREENAAAALEVMSRFAIDPRLLAYLPPSEARIGNELAVSYMEELYPVTVGSVDATPLFDPANERMR